MVNIITFILIISPGGRLEDVSEKEIPYKTYISKTLPRVEDLASYSRKADGIIKMKIPVASFQENPF